MEIIIEPFTGLKCKRGDKFSESERSKSIIADRDRDLFKGRFYMDVGIMWRAHSGQPGITSGTFERCGITSGGGF
ncbi:MAG: hypothetical protein GQ523_12000 [Methanophagales archaeon]|nr:hypothetical protein [Methanophagales archaeon]